MKYLITLAFALYGATAMAAGDAAAGKAKAAACQACHGANGVAIAPIYPNLAGQKAAYMVAQLKAFKSGERKGANAALMAPMAMPLSDQDMEDISAYFAEMPAAK